MISVLVVDDSQSDLRLVGELLEANADIEVWCAEDGVGALEKMERSEPDLVVTDLVMPRMDGLKLVTVAREKHPLVPVILITARGNEEIAVEALERGAASYVPKRNLAEDLLDTVRTVLALSRSERREAEMLECLTRQKCVFVLGNDVPLIHALVRHLQEEAARMGLRDKAERTRLGVALEVALTNAVCYGNLEIGLELRQQDRAAWDALVAQRRGEAPYRDRRLRVEATVSRSGASFVVRDEGPGFDPSTLPNPADPASLEETGGRRGLLMNTLLDEVVYSETGSTVTLVKRWSPEDNPSDTEGC